MKNISLRIKLVGLWVALLAGAGCSGIQPYEAPNYRDNPPVNGMLTGPEGEFVIMIKNPAWANSGEADEGSDEAETGETPDSKKDENAAF
ncbi:MAG: hypothetical protein PVI39_09575 [Desulfobacteraceae bacterium]|jgi:hypothetical protein